MNNDIALSLMYQLRNWNNDLKTLKGIILTNNTLLEEDLKLRREEFELRKAELEVMREYINVNINRNDGNSYYKKQTR